MTSTTQRRFARVVLAPGLLVAVLLLLLLSANRSVAQRDCTATSALAATERRNEPSGGPIWFWTLAIKNATCTPSSGNYEYELVYTDADGKTHREARSGLSWGTADSQHGSVRTVETLPSGAISPKLQNIEVTSCSCT